MKPLNIQEILNKIYPIKSNSNIILAHGEFPRDSYLQSLLCIPPTPNSNKSTLICCDGAIENLIKPVNYCEPAYMHPTPTFREPDYIIGDCDSINSVILQKYSDRIITISDQNSNDLTKAINLAHELGLDNIVILGATGLREDHTIANLALLATYAPKFNHIAIISDHGIFTVHTSTDFLTTIVGQQISFFTVNAATTITCRELKWPLDEYKCKSWYSGTLNEAIDTTIKVLINNGHAIIFRTFNFK